MTTVTDKALMQAEDFISGFEGDPLQDGIGDLLALIRVARDTSLLDQIKTAIADGSLLQSDVLVALSKAGAAKNFAGHIETAREQYVDDDTEVDDDPMVSEGDDGIWVSAWVWVNHSEVPGYLPPEDKDEEGEPA